MEGIYKKVYVKSAADLPKEDEVYYFGYYKENVVPFSVIYYDYDIRDVWLKSVDWYLQPVTAKDEQETNEQPYYCIESTLNNQPVWWTGVVPHLATEDFNSDAPIWEADIHKAKKFNSRKDACAKSLEYQIFGQITEHLDVRNEQPKRVSADVLESAMIIQQIWRKDDHNPDWAKRAETVNVLMEYASQHPFEQEKPSDQSAEEMIDLQQYVTNLLYYAHVEAMDMHSIDFDRWVESQVDNIKEFFASQKHTVTDDMISAKLDTVNFETSRERETAFDLLVWLRDKIK